MQIFMSRFSFVFDRLHPHQYTKEQYISVLEANGLKVKHSLNVDAQVGSLNRKTNSYTKNTLKTYLKPGNLFFAILKLLFGISRYSHEGPKSAYSHELFICTKSQPMHSF